MICCIAMALAIIVPAAILEALWRAEERAREKRQWKWIKARYYPANAK